MRAYEIAMSRDSVESLDFVDNPSFALGAIYTMLQAGHTAVAEAEPDNEYLMYMRVPLEPMDESPSND